MFLWRDPPQAVAKPAAAVRVLVEPRLKSLLEEERRGLRSLFPPTAVARDLAGALIQAATHRGYTELPTSLFERPAKESRLFSALPDLHDRLDNRHMLPTDGLQVTPQALLVGGFALSFHQFLRRNFTDNVNDALVRTLMAAQEGTGATLRFAIDERRLRRAADQVLWIEKDYWSGPHLSEEALDNTRGHFPQVSIHGWPIGADRAPWDIHDRFEVRWSVDQDTGEKTFEAEELRDPASLAAGDELVVVRFLHAIRVPSRRAFRHVDGAVRAYSREAYRQRRELRFATPADNVVSHYRKVFRADGDLSTEVWSNIVAQWFRGNQLATEYLGQLAAT